MSLTRIELETILSSETASEQQKAEASALLLKIVPTKSKPLELWEADETGCRPIDVWLLSWTFNTEPDADFRKKLFSLARERYPRFAEEFTKQEAERKPDAFTWTREHARMVRWAADPTGNLTGITHSVTGD
jgi:hypothetical protein